MVYLPVAAIRVSSRRCSGGQAAGADFREGELHQLPVADQSVDLVVCAPALTHAVRPYVSAARPKVPWPGTLVPSTRSRDGVD